MVRSLHVPILHGRIQDSDGMRGGSVEALFLRRTSIMQKWGQIIFLVVIGCQLDEESVINVRGCILIVKGV